MAHYPIQPHIMDDRDGVELTQANRYPTDGQGTRGVGEEPALLQRSRSAPLQTQLSGDSARSGGQGAGFSPPLE